MKLHTAIIQFIEWLEFIKNHSQKTVEQYLRHLEKLEEYFFILGKKDIDIEDITLQDLNNFRIFVHKSSKKKISQKTANAYMITMRSFFKYLEKKDFKIISPTKIDLIKDEERKVDFLTLSELEQLLDSIGEIELRDIRDKTIIKMISTTGLRVSELTKLNKKDIDLKRKEFTIRGKGRKIRMIFLSDETCEFLRNYLELRKDTFTPLFIRHNYDRNNRDILKDEELRLTRHFITDMVKKRAIEAHIIKKVSAHTLRHTFATTLLGAGADLRSIQELLGHANISTTQIYMHVTNPKLKEVHNKFIK